MNEPASETTPRFQATRWSMVIRTRGDDPLAK